VGAVLVNGPSRFLGFLGNDALTRESLTDSGDYRTGDMGYLDEDGYFRFVARAKDIIRRGAITIVPSEVTPVILGHPSVREVEIVPLPDERLGERACAAIILVEGATPPTLDELREFLDQHGVAKYTWPESLEVFDEFPRTPASLRVIKATVVKQILERSQQQARVVDPV
jgi:non-ribosomal peptide synthetase component E (peptide arylation enzyme)